MLFQEINELLKEYKEYVDRQNDVVEITIYNSIQYEINGYIELLNTINEKITNLLNEIKNKINLLTEEDLLQMIDID